MAPDNFNQPYFTKSPPIFSHWAHGSVCLVTAHTHTQTAQRSYTPSPLFPTLHCESSNLCILVPLQRMRRVAAAPRFIRPWHVITLQMNMLGAFARRQNKRLSHPPVGLDRPVQYSALSPSTRVLCRGRAQIISFHVSYYPLLASYTDTQQIVCWGRSMLIPRPHSLHTRTSTEAAGEQSEARGYTHLQSPHQQSIALRRALHPTSLPRSAHWKNCLAHPKRDLGAGEGEGTPASPCHRRLRVGYPDGMG